MIFIKNLYKKKFYTKKKTFLIKKNISSKIKFLLKKKPLIKNKLFHLGLIDGKFQD